MKLRYNRLWNILIDKNMHKVQLRKATGISTHSLAKLDKNEPVSMEVLMKNTNTLECKVKDLLETSNSAEKKPESDEVQ